MPFFQFFCSCTSLVTNFGSYHERQLPFALLFDVLNEVAVYAFLVAFKPIIFYQIGIYSLNNSQAWSCIPTCICIHAHSNSSLRLSGHQTLFFKSDFIHACSLPSKRFVHLRGHCRDNKREEFEKT